MKNIRFFGGVLLVLAMGMTSCGYTTKTVLPRNIKTIYVETVKNKLKVENIWAYQPGLEMDITNAVIRRLQTNGNLKVVKQPDADSILKIDLLSFEQEGLRFDQLESVQEYRLYIVADVKLIDAKTKDLIWEEPNFTGDNEYYVSTVSSIGEQKAAGAAVDKLAKNIVARIVEDW